MQQHSIDLLPAAIRARCDAGMQTGRIVLGMALGVIAVAAVSAHSMFTLVAAQNTLFATSQQAQEVFALEARAAELRSVLERSVAFTKLYDKMALPLDISAVLATVVNQMPESVTLDQVDIDAGARPISRSPRAKGLESNDETPPRVLTGEVSGFAATDQHIAELVKRLEEKPPFRDVSLDFSRSRRVNGHDAREFRLSFRIELDEPYRVAYVDELLQSASAAEGSHERE